MSTKRKKRITLPVRMEKRVHAGLKIHAKKERITLSKLASEICRPVAEAAEKFARTSKALGRKGDKVIWPPDGQSGSVPFFDIDSYVG